MGTNPQVKYAHASGCFVNSVIASMSAHEGLQSAEKSLLTLKSECPVSGSDSPITIAKQLYDLTDITRDRAALFIVLVNSSLD
jgi:hypothetical protein